MGRIIRIEEGLIRRLLSGISNLEIESEEILNINGGDGEHIVSIYLNSKYAEFNEDLRDMANMGPGLRPLLDYFEREGYETNLK